MEKKKTAMSKDGKDEGKLTPETMAGLAQGTQGGAAAEPGGLAATAGTERGTDPDAGTEETAQQELTEQSGPWPGGAMGSLASRLLAEEADIRQVFPQFDLERFLTSDERIQAALMQGRSLWSLFAGVYGEIVRRQAEAEALERIRSRNSSLPEAMRSAGAAGAAAPDYANMPSEQFSRMRKDFEAQMRLGKKIRP